MKKLITLFLILTTGILFSANAFAKDIKNTQAVTLPVPKLVKVIGLNTSYSQQGHYPYPEITVIVSGATSTEQTYRFYYANYSGDERKKTWKWLQENGKIKTSKPMSEKVADLEPYNGIGILVVDKNDWGMAVPSQQVFAWTIVDDKTGTESEPSPILVY